MSRPTPLVTLIPLDELPTSVAAGDGRVLVDALRITWGRSSVLDQPTPSTASFTVLDRSASATFASRTDLVGQLVELGYVLASHYTCNFRGRITDADITPFLGGFLVTLSASSTEVEMANYTLPAATTWPAETFAVRAARIRDLIPGGLWTSNQAQRVVLPTRADVGLPPDAANELGSYPVPAADVSGKDALTLLRELAASMSPLPLVYRPAQRGFWPSARRVYAAGAGGQTYTAGLVSSPANGGRYVASAVGGADLDAGDLAFSGSLTQPLESRLTQIQVTYSDQAAGYAQATATATTPDAASESTVGRRTLSVSSIHASAAGAAQLAGLYAALAAAEARAPRLDPVTYRTDIAGGFDTDAHAAWLLAGYETDARFFLGRSWLAQLKVRPIVGVIGGQISYAGGEWSVQMTPAAVAVDDTTRTPLQIKYAGAHTVRLVDVDRSVTFADTRFLDIGAGYTAATQPPTGGPIL